MKTGMASTDENYDQTTMKIMDEHYDENWNENWDEHYV